jgi:hypothetical protein
MYHKILYVSKGSLSLKTLKLYIYWPKGTLKKQTTIQPIIFFLYGIRESYHPVT